MKIDNVKEPKSSFLSVEKDTNLIVDAILKNERLKRLLFYTSSDALQKPNISQQDSLDLIGKNIKIVPKVSIDSSVLNYILINFNHFSIGRNPQFRDNNIEFNIVCHFDQWQLKDFALRPFKIAAELDSMFNDAKMTGIGRLEFSGASQIVLTDEFAGLSLIYRAVHGGEDKTKMPNPADEARFMQDFQALVNGV